MVFCHIKLRCTVLRRVVRICSMVCFRQFYAVGMYRYVTHRQCNVVRVCTRSQVSSSILWTFNYVVLVPSQSYVYCSVLNVIDPKQRFEFYKRLEEVTKVKPIPNMRKNTMPRKEYFQG